MPHPHGPARCISSLYAQYASAGGAAMI